MPFPVRFLIVLLALLFGLFTETLWAQITIHGMVKNQVDNRPVSFASVRIAGTDTGVVADIQGHFEMRIASLESTLEVAHNSFHTRTVSLPDSGKPVLIFLQPGRELELAEVRIRPAGNTIRRLLNNAIRQRRYHNPENLPAYQCGIYYRMHATMAAGAKLNDSALLFKIDSFTDKQHLFLAETRSHRYYRAPGKLHEDVYATRFSGLQTPAFTNLVTDFLPFQIQSDFIRLGNKDYPNPVAPAYESRYHFQLAGTITNEADTTWQIDYQPRPTVNGFTGTLFLSSDGYVVQKMTATVADSTLGTRTAIEVQYQKTGGRWFPEKLNYRIEWHQMLGGLQKIFIEGSSRIDSVAFTLPDRYRFDNAHTAVLLPGATDHTNTAWEAIRPEVLTQKDTQTYHVIDSFGRALKTDNIFRFSSALSKGRFPLGKLDFNLNRVFSYSDYEGNRYGLGLQTTEGLWKHGEAGIWAGYGSGDKTWKYGSFATWFFDRYQEQKLTLAYSKSLRDPGRVWLTQELENDYARQYLIQRAEEATQFSATLENRFGFLSTTLEALQEDIRARYQYSFLWNGEPTTNFRNRQLSLRLRYAYGEKRAYAFGSYLPLPTRYPIVYLNVTGGNIQPLEKSANSASQPYLQLLAGLRFSTHINRLGSQQFLLMGAQNISESPLPMSKLFAARGYRIHDYAWYSFGNFYTFLPYEIFTDRFAGFHFRNAFDFHFYKTKFSFPYPAVGYHFLMGTLSQPEVHSGIDFSVPNEKYHEAGLAIHDLLRLNVAGFRYATLQCGYYARILNRESLRKGVAVIGFGFSL